MAVSLDGLVGPLAGEAELTPGADVALRATSVRGRPLEASHPRCALGAEDSVELRDGELSDGIVLVDEDHQPVGMALDVEGAGGDDDVGGRGTADLVEREDAREGGRAA